MGLYRDNGKENGNYNIIILYLDPCCKATSKDWTLADVLPCTFPAALPVLNQWDPKWVGLAITYFSSITWRVDSENPFARTSLVELMLDLMVSYQTCLPVNLKLFPGCFLGAPLLKQESKAYYWLPSASEQLKMPKRMLSEWTHTHTHFPGLL